jgi:hypothetical protein
MDNGLQILKQMEENRKVLRNNKSVQNEDEIGKFGLKTIKIFSKKMN